MRQAATPQHPAANATANWDGRPRLAASIRVFVALVPLVASIGATWLLARAWSPAEGVDGLIRFVCLLVVGSAVLVGVDRLARRLLPLATLLKMSLVFPDAAPSRFGLAMKSGTTKQLEREVDELRAKGLATNETAAAEQMLKMVAALSKHDRFTRGHSERVRAYAVMIADEMGLSDGDRSRLQWAALVHDVGKLAVPAEILNKSGRLTDEEFEIIKTHPAEGAAIAEPLRPWLGDWIDAVAQHHERPDGSGYPLGLRGDQISLAARIVSVADAFDVITAARSYKRPMSPQHGRQELADGVGTQFDDEVVRAFLSVSIGRLRLAMGPLAWLAQLPHLGPAFTAPAANVLVAASVAIGATTTGAVVADSAPPEQLAFEPAVMVETTGKPTLSAAGTAQHTAATSVVALDRPAATLDTTTSSPTASTSVPSTTDASIPAAPTTAAPTAAAPTTAAPTTAAPTTAAPTTAASTTAAPTTAAPTTAPPTTAPPTTAPPTPCETVQSGNADLGSVDLTNCDLTNLVVTDAYLIGADLRGADLRGATIQGGTWEGADLSGADLRDASISGVHLGDVVLTNAVASGAVVADANFGGATLRNADFSNATILRTSFGGADLSGANFSGTTNDRSNYDGVTAPDASFVGASLPATWMRGSDFARANFTGANLRESNLGGSNLTQATLTSADLFNADLQDTRLTATVLQQTNLEAAYGWPIDHESAVWSSTICPDTSVRSTSCFA